MGKLKKNGIFAFFTKVKNAAGILTDFEKPNLGIWGVWGGVFGLPRRGFTIYLLKGGSLLIDI